MLLIVAILAAWVVTLLLKPFGRCWLCRGKRVRIVKHRRKARARKCWACKGVGRRQRLGSRTVHRIRRTAMSAWRDEPASRGGA